MKGLSGKRRGWLSLAACALLFAPMSSVSAQQAQVSEGQRLAMYTKPSVVRIYDGYVGTFVWDQNNKVYQVAYVGSGSGSFIDPNGYIVLERKQGSAA